MNENGSTIFVDANIPMYAHGAEHPLRESCRAAIAKLGRREIEACTSVEIHQELLHRYLSLRRPAEAVHVSRDFAIIVPVILPVTRQDIETTWNFMARYPGLHTRDYVHMAVMFNNHLTRILSTDTHFDLVSEIERIPPERLAP